MTALRVTPGRRPRAELVLAVLAVASLALIPIQITTIYSGLPAHPLFLHVPVVLIPVAVIGALLVAARPRWILRYGVPLAGVTVVALAGTFVTVGAGVALRNALHLGGAGAGGFGGVSGPAALVARHAHAASILRLWMIGFTAVMILAVLAHRVAAGRSTGRVRLDRVLAAAATLLSARVLLVVLAIACGYFVFHTGDLGAKAVWAGRLSSHRGGSGAGGPGGFPFGPGGGGGGP